MAQYKIASGQQFGAVTRRMVGMGMHLPDSVVEEGMGWYPAVHETVKAQAPDVGLTTSQGAGVVAAVSPNMDFDARNIKALGEIRNISPRLWDDIHRSASRRDATTGAVKPRLSGVKDELQEVAPSLAGAYDQSLVKAHRILQGQQVGDVLSMRTAPKTATFAQNIADPRSTGVTVDGRSGDVVANIRRPWELNRGLESAQLPSGKETRYESHDRAHVEAGKRLTAQDPRYAGATPKDIQAILWLGAKGIERSQPTKSGAPRVQGEKRQGQPYVTPSGQPLERDSHFWDQA